MLKIGFIDDEKDMIEDYRARLKRRDIDLIFADNCETKEDIVEWILGNNLKCVLVDYKLTQVYNFMGTDLVAYLNAALPDLSCIILTNFPEEGINDNLVLERLIIDRNLLDQTSLDGFVNIVKQAIQVFDKRLAIRYEEFVKLKQKKENDGITASEEERFFILYKILRVYAEVDDIPTDLLKSSTNTKIDQLIQKLDSFIGKTEEI